MERDQLVQLGIARMIPAISQFQVRRREVTVARVIRVAASFPHFWMSWSTLMIRFTRIRGSCVVGSLPWPVRLAAGGGVGVMFRW
jgi:hypothetical protein